MAAEALKAAASEMLEAEAIAAETLAEASDMMEETSIVGDAVIVIVELRAARAEVTFPAAKSDATGPSVGNPVNEDP